MPTTALCSACVLSHRQQLKPAYLGSLEKRDPHTLPVPFTSCIPTLPLANTDLTSASTGGLFWRLRTARPGHWLLSPSTMLPGPSCAEEESALHFFLLQPKERATFYLHLFQSHQRMWNLPAQGSNPSPLEWKPRTWATGPPGSFLFVYFY